MIYCGVGRTANLHRNAFVSLPRQRLLTSRSRADFLHFNPTTNYNSSWHRNVANISTIVKFPFLLSNTIPLYQIFHIKVIHTNPSLN